MKFDTRDHLVRHVSGRNEEAPGRKPFERFKPRDRLNKPNLFATDCHRLPLESDAAVTEGGDEIQRHVRSSFCRVTGSPGVTPVVTLPRK